jgi:hypothetical protein
MDITRPPAHISWPPRSLKANDLVVIAIQRSLFSGVEEPSTVTSSKEIRVL